MSTDTMEAVVPTDSSVIDELKMIPDFAEGIVVIGEREGGLVECMVDVSVIDNEEVPVKEEYADSLATQMQGLAELEGGTGQQTPVMLGLIPGEGKLKIMDGFHREAALRRNGQDEVFGTVKLVDWNGLYDFRIFTAKDHTQVRFSRVVQWIQEVWEHSGLSDRLDVEQAFLMYRHDNDGSKIGFDPNNPEDVAATEAAKAWVANKEEQWDMAAMTIHSHLATATRVDEDLVHSAREQKHGKALTSPTQSILKVFSTVIPNDSGLQHLVMDAAIAHNLTTPQVRALCTKVKDLETLSEATRELGEINFDNWQPEYGETKRRSIRQAHDPRQKGERVFDKSDHEISSVTQRLEQTVERGEEVTPVQAENILKAARKAQELRDSLGTMITKARAIVKDVEAAQLPDAPEEPVRAPEIDHDTEENPIAKRFKGDIREYLNGKLEFVPRIKTRLDISRAESVLREGGFYGDPELGEDVRDAIDSARRSRTDKVDNRSRLSV